jgi:tRNA(adenine34) deaminase
MRQAIEEAKAALARGDRPIGCVIVYRGRIIARGSNREFTRKSKFEHAETATLRDCAAFLFDHSEECTLYTTVEPCVMCLGAIVMANIRKVVFGAPDPKRGGGDMYRQVQYVRKSIHRGYVGGVLAQASQGLLEAFAAKAGQAPDNEAIRESR